MHVIRSPWQWALGFVVVVLAACGGSKSDTTGPVPTASLSVAANVPVNAVVTLNGAASTVATGTISYRWVLSSKPTGSAATISDVTISAPTLTPDLVGSYAFSLTVSDGTKSTTVSGSTTAAVVAPPVITTDIAEPLSGSVKLALSSNTGVSTADFNVDGTDIGTALPLTWDTTTVANGARVVGARLQFFGNYYVNVTRTLQVNQTTVSFSNQAVSTSNGQVTAIVSATSANGIVRVAATLDGVVIGSLAVPNACTDSTGVACATTGLNGYSFVGTVATGPHLVVVTATDGIGNSLSIQLPFTAT